MNRASTDPATRPLRLWPGVVAVVAQWVGRFVVPFFFPETLPYGVLTSLACGVVIVAWWVFFSRIPRLERWGGLALLVGAFALTPLLLHESIAGGMMGMMFAIYAVPTVSLALVAWAVFVHSLAPEATQRRVALAVAIVLGVGFWTLVRTGGMTGAADSDFAWRWAPTAEDRLLARADEPIAPVPVETEAEIETADWPGFRGRDRDGVIVGSRIETDWTASPPVELWRRAVGPGWSSFAVAGDLVYTQEQRGEDEVVAAYQVSTGEPAWMHRDAARFWESNAGAGPRGTPALYEGRVHTLGGTGLVNVLDAATGAVVWSRDAQADTGAATPDWGFSGSPLVTDDLVVVAVSGDLVAYDRATGEPRWFGPEEGGTSYSSPRLATIDGVEQILLLDGAGALGLAPADGAVLWRHEWPGYPIVQPARTADGDLLVAMTERSGLRRLSVEKEAGEWRVEELWTSIRLKPYFNDFVVHEGHAYGFDGRILASIDVENGERDWKGGRYGNGQLVLLADQDLLLVLSEEGELVLVEATPERFAEIARVPALDGKTWNHPVLVDDLLLVRNDREMAAFRLDLRSSGVASRGAGP